MRSASNQLDLFADYAPPAPIAVADPVPAGIVPFPLARTRHVADLVSKLAGMRANAARVTFYQRELSRLIAQRQRQGLHRETAVADVEQLHRIVKFMIEAPPAPRTSRRQEPAPVIAMHAMAAR